MTHIRDAATVVVIRGHQKSLQLLMLRRHHGHEFMANAWVFPGGSLDDRDGDPHLAKRIAGLDAGEAARRLGDGTEPERALALYVAALRETFEEAGLLLARRCGEDQPLALDDPAVSRRFEDFRTHVDEGRWGLAEVCRRENLILECDKLAYLAHWITPDFESRRYDTRFFIAPAPPQQRPSHDDGETTHRAWWTPGEAIERYRDGEILLAPPTLRILEELSDYSSFEQLFEDVRRRPAPPAILPHPIDGDSRELILTLPGDPEYPGEFSESTESTGEASRDGITRMVRREGQWFSIASEQ